MQEDKMSMGEIINYIVQNVEEKGVVAVGSKEDKMYRIGDNIVMLTVTCDRNGVPLRAGCNKGREIYLFDKDQAKILNDACIKKVEAQNEEKAKLEAYQKQKEEFEKEKQRIIKLEKRYKSK